LKYEIVVSITNKEEIEEVKSYLLNVSLPSDDTVFLDYESAKLIQLYDEHDNKILETTGQYLQMSKDEMVRVVDFNIPILEKYYEEYRLHSNM